MSNILLLFDFIYLQINKLQQQKIEDEIKSPRIMYTIKIQFSLWARIEYKFPHILRFKHSLVCYSVSVADN